MPGIRQIGPQFARFRSDGSFDAHVFQRAYH
jgi:hypothetical protein